MKKERDLAKIAKDAKRGRRRPRARIRNFVFFVPFVAKLSSSSCSRSDPVPAKPDQATGRSVV